MADRTIKIEIPVEVLDNTSDGTKGVVQNLSKMEKAMLKMEKQSRQHTSKMEESLSKTEEKMERVHDVELSAEDNATPVIHNVEDALDRVSGTSADVELGADDSATPVIKGVEDSVAQTDGISADVELGADDSATPVIKGVEDSAESLGGTSATVELGAEDTASSIIDMVRDKLHSLGGMAVSAVVGAADTASEVIDRVLDKLSSYEGTTWNTTIGVVNAVTSPIGKIGGVIGNPLAQAGAVAGVSFGVADSVNTFKDFEQMMSSVKAISSATAAEFDVLTDKAKQMGADTKFSAYESAEAFNYMAMAGWKPQQMIDGIAGVMNLAAASGEDLGSTSDIVADAITAFGMQAGDATHFADVLAQASANANTNVGMLGESFKYVAPVAGAMKYSVEDTSLALGLMANASIKGSMAGTALKTSIANMASPTANMAAAMDKYGISLTETDGSMKSLKGVMDNLRTSLGGLSETEQTAAASTIFGKEAMSGMLAIINAAEEDYNKLTEAVYNADGASERMADTMMDNLAGSFELLSGAMDEVKMTLGDRLSPYLKSGADALAEFMPEVKAGVTEFMDFVDGKAEKMKSTITSMTNSEEWADADFMGKVDIAWNELIGEPFMDWATGDGAHLVSKGISSLFSSAAAILPGGEQAGIGSLFSAMFLTKGMRSLTSGTKTLLSSLIPVRNAFRGIENAAQKSTGIRSFVSELKTLIPFSTKFGIAATAATAGAVGLAVAIDRCREAAEEYDQKMIDKNLEEHFGDIHLTGEQAGVIADQVIPANIIADLKLAGTTFEEADELKEQAEAILEENNFLNWKLSTVGLTAEETNIVLENAETFKNNVEDALEKEEYAAELTVKALLKETESSAIVAQMQTWFKEDKAKVDTLSSAVTSILQEAVDEGTYNVDTAAAVSILQQKMMEIVNGAEKSRLEGSLKWITAKASSAALDAESWAEVSEDIDARVQEMMDNKDAQYDATYQKLEEYAGNDPSRRGTVNAIENLLEKSYMNLGSDAASLSWEYKYRGISEAYNKELESAKTNIESSTNDWFAFFQSEMTRAERMKEIGAPFDPMEILNGIWDQSAGIGGGMDSATQGALLDRFETMMPTVEQLQDVIDKKIQDGEKVSQSVYDSYWQAMELGAAAGDENSISAMMAKRIAGEFGSKTEFSGMLESAGLSFDVLPEAIQDNLDRAFAETENIDVSGLSDEIVDLFSKEDVNWAAVEGLLNKYGLSISEGLSQQGIDIEGKAKVNADGVELDPSELVKNLEGLSYVGTTELEGGEVAFQYTVNEGETLSGIMRQYGVVWSDVEQQIREANPEISDLNLIYPGQVINLPEAVLETAGIDTSHVQSAVEEATSALTAEGAEFSVTAEGVTVDLSGVEVDSASAAAQIEAALGMEAGTLGVNGIAVETGATVTVPSELIQINTSALEASTQEAADQANPAPVDAETSANVTVTESETDTFQARGQAQSETEAAFEEPFTPAGHADVTLDQTNNAGAIYSEVDAEIDSKFSAGFSTSAHVDVTLDWAIVNPTANISVGGAGSGSASVSAAFHAEGGLFGNPHLGLVAEDGPEAIIPLGAKRRERGIDLWMQAGAMLGISQYADGGIVGNSKYSDTLFESGSSTDSGKEASGDQVGISVESGNSNVQVTVNMAPTFEISNDNPDTVLNMVKRQLNALTNDMTAEIARRVADSFANTPA